MHISYEEDFVDCKFHIYVNSWITLDSEHHTIFLDKHKRVNYKTKY